MQTTEQAIITPQSLLNSWQGHRSLTKKTIECFPEKELFEFSVGGMRPFADIAKELLAIAAPGLKSIVTGTQDPYDAKMAHLKTKQDILQAWDESTEQINSYFPQISLERFHEMFNLFGEYKFPVIQNVQYFIDNEIHHRGQGYVYLRALGIEPPKFWERAF